MTIQDALDFTEQMITAGRDGIQEALNPNNPDKYYQGYNQGYIAGLESALDILNRHRQYFPKQAVIVTGHYYTEPTCPDCGHPLAGGGCEVCGDA